MSSDPIAAPVAETPERRAFYDRISRQNLTPLWLSLARLVTPEPVSACRPAAWAFADIRAAMLEAGGLITAKEAERRVLVLENPGLRGQSKITTDLYAGVQLVLPGEVAPAHRHAQSALRFVLEGGGAHTASTASARSCRKGTSSSRRRWRGTTTATRAIARSSGSMASTSRLSSSSTRRSPSITKKTSRPSPGRSGDCDARFGSNLLPVDYTASTGASPVFSYPYARTREALERLRRTGAWDPCHGLKMRYTNPVTGGYPMTTIAAFIQLLPKGFTTAPYRSTDATVFVAVEGRGRTRIGPYFVVEWQPRDIFVVPSWQQVRHEVADDAVLFSFSDRPIQAALQLFREDRGGA